MWHKNQELTSPTSGDRYSSHAGSGRGVKIPRYKGNNLWCTSQKRKIGSVLVSLSKMSIWNAAAKGLYLKKNMISEVFLCLQKQ
jgi:hypothetical protein